MHSVLSEKRSGPTSPESVEDTRMERRNEKEVLIQNSSINYGKYCSGRGSRSTTSSLLSLIGLQII